MCATTNDRGRETSGATKREGPIFRLFKAWENRDRSRSVGGNLLRQLQLRQWFRWTFIDLDRHAVDCKWAATLRKTRLPFWS